MSIITKTPIVETRGRTILHCEERTTLDYMTVETHLFIEEVTDLSKASLVSSRDSKGLHRPALDIDVPVAMVPGGEHGSRLWLDLKCSDRAFANLFLVLREFMIIDAKYTGPLGRRKEKEMYERESAVVIPTRDLPALMCELAPTFKGSYDQLLHQCAKETSPRRRDLSDGPEMRNPRMLPLFVGAQLLRSTKNHHLYLDTIMSWAGYQRLIDAMVKAHAIDKDYRRLAQHRKATELRVPWNSKRTSPVPR